MRHVRRGALAVAPILALVSVGDISWARPQAADAPRILELEGDIAPVHDPVAIKEKGTYYVFCTGGRNGQGVMPIRTSKDMRTWKAAGFVFESLPEWVARGDSRWPATRGRRTSRTSTASTTLLLGVVVRQPQLRHRAGHDPTLDPSSPDYRWTDEGMVLRSYQDKDDWNAIDPNLVSKAHARVARVGQLLGRHQDATRRSVLWKAVRRRRDDALAQQPSARAADQRLRRSAVHRPSRRLLVPVRLVRSLLPRRRRAPTTSSSAARGR